jgi:hypothetical protein
MGLLQAFSSLPAAGDTAHPARNPASSSPNFVETRMAPGRRNGCWSREPSNRVPLRPGTVTLCDQGRKFKRFAKVRCTASRAVASATSTLPRSNERSLSGAASESSYSSRGRRSPLTLFRTVSAGERSVTSTLIKAGTERSAASCGPYSAGDRWRDGTARGSWHRNTIAVVPSAGVDAGLAVPEDERGVPGGGESKLEK